MTIKYAVAAVVVAVALFAGATAAEPMSESQDSALEELAAARAKLIEQQQTLIVAQEDLLNVYRCMLKVDVEVVPGGCPGQEFSEAETADGAVMCAGWLAERERTEERRQFMLAGAHGLRSGIIGLDNAALPPALANMRAYRDQVAAVIPALQSERFTGLMTAMADHLEEVADVYEQGGSASEVADAIFAAADQLDELDTALAELCA